MDLKNVRQIRGGFTLVELVVVLTILSLMVGLATVSLVASLSSADLDRAAGEMMSLTRRARDLSMHRNSTVAIVFYEQEQKCLLVEPGIDGAEDKPLPSEDQVSNELKLPNNITFAEIVTPSDTRQIIQTRFEKTIPLRKRICFTRFGTVGSAKITLKNSGGKELSLISDPPTGYFYVLKEEEEKK